MEQDILKTKLEQADDTTTYDLKVSYSKLEVFNNCPYRYDLSYNQNLKGLEQGTIALDVGSLCHKVLELKGNMIINGEAIDYDLLEDVLENGEIGTNVSDSDEVIGTKSIKNKYGFESWYIAEEDNHSYNDKLSLYKDKVLRSEVPDNQGDEHRWHVLHTELPFKFIYKLDVNGEEKRILFNGFIDRVDTRMNANGNVEYRVVDYKTSKKVYDNSKLATALQMIIYGFFIYLHYGSLPTEYEYSFILLNDKQKANSLGYLKRGIKKIDKLLLSIFTNEKTGTWEWKPSPLCYWCDYRIDSSIGDPIVGDKCKHYSLWTPTNKVFSTVDSDIFAALVEQPKTEKRKLIF